MYRFIFLLALSIPTIVFSQEAKFEVQDLSISPWIDGTLLVPRDIEKPPLAIIIAGSGPTNRDGNQNFMKNNSLKKLAEGLSSEGIATFRYDKRIVKQIRQGNVDNNIMFDDFIKDALDVIAYFKAGYDFSKIVVIGHSQGSLVGMLAAKDKADGFVSLAGAGQNIGDVLIEQVTKTAPMFSDDTKRIVEGLKNGETTTDFPVALASIFNSDIQAFMMNWMKYNPTDIVQNLEIPVLIMNGTKDLQVSVNEAQLLKEANNKAELKIIENMNHVLFEIQGDDLENSKSYNESSRPISKELIESIVTFIKS
ncbi:alpha/beta hydrolase family protein [Winogradskyella aurantia]|uniref:Alpha/beta hydrolase n=1 Tax=Winogradskyella aurantia TaxID=1915063 RepID=A0A265UQK4_9FLAO|nr:alpha/beta hydrolase [Winogradskyella aurantia]OZV67502.1 alpha/beta hydrolase [Winogradskyella aurantia]